MDKISFFVSNLEGTEKVEVPAQIAQQFAYFMHAKEIVCDSEVIEAKIPWRLDVARMLFQYMLDNQVKFPARDWAELMFIMNFLDISRPAHKEIVQSFGLLLAQELRHKIRVRLDQLSECFDKFTDEWIDEIISPENFNQLYFLHLALCTGKLRERAFARRVHTIDRFIGINTRDDWTEMSKLATQFPSGFKVNLIVIVSELWDFSPFPEMRALAENMNKAACADIFNVIVQRLGTRSAVQEIDGIGPFDFNVLPTNGSIIASRPMCPGFEEALRLLSSPQGKDVEYVKYYSASEHWQFDGEFGPFLDEVLKMKNIRPSIIEIIQRGRNTIVRLGELNSGRSFTIDILIPYYCILFNFFDLYKSSSIIERIAIIGEEQFSIHVLSMCCPHVVSTKIPHPPTFFIKPGIQIIPLLKRIQKKTLLENNTVYGLYNGTFNCGWR
jgi:hypothetical protein